MDWMGGTRRRYLPKGRHDEVLQKQKAHFAKKRAAADAEEHASHSKRHQPAMSSHRHNDTDHQRPRSKRSNSRLSDRGSKKHHSSRHHHDQSPSSRPASSNDKFVKQKKRHRTTFPRQSLPAHMTEEEQLLLANRERLLARTDWLGLAASRPERYRYPSHSDKDRIGKRRKVHKSRAPKPQPRERTPVSSAFGEKLAHREHLMSGALPDESIKIKVGTDAFASQTQPSQVNKTPINTSMRQPSTEFGPLSEEPMLIRVDENGFEQHNDGSNPGFPGNLSNTDTAYASMQPNIQNYSNYTDIQATLPSYAEESTMPFGNNSIPDDESFEDLDADYDPYQTHDRPPENTHIQYQPHDTTVTDHHPYADEIDGMTAQLMKQYQQLTSVDQYTTSVQPSSLHATRATTDNWPTESNLSYRYRGADPPTERQTSHPSAPVGVSNEFYYNDPNETVVQEADTESILDPLDSRNGPADYQEATVTDTVLRSPNSSELRAAEARDNELWRQFVIGSQSSESDFSEPTNRSQMDLWRQTDSVLPAYSASSKELASSDKATAGVGDLSDRVSRAAPSEYRTNTSMVAQATTIHPEYEQTDVPGYDGAANFDDLQSFTTGNIHASSVATRKRERPGKLRRPTRSAPLTSTRLATLTRPNGREQQRSVFDLQDID